MPVSEALQIAVVVKHSVLALKGLQGELGQRRDQDSVEDIVEFAKYLDGQLCEVGFFVSFLYELHAVIGTEDKGHYKYLEKHI